MSISLSKLFTMSLYFSTKHETSYLATSDYLTYAVKDMFVLRIIFSIYISKETTTIITNRTKI